MNLSISMVLGYFSVFPLGISRGTAISMEQLRLKENIFEASLKVKTQLDCYIQNILKTNIHSTSLN